MAEKFARTLCLILLLGVILSGCGPEAVPAPAEEVVSEAPAEEVAVEAPEAELEDTIREFVHYANDQYAAALEAVDAELVESTTHGTAREFVADQVERLASEGLYRVSQREIEVVTAYLVGDEQAIAKTIEFWAFEERDAESQEVRRTDSAGPLYETYYIESVDGRWSVADIEILDGPTLTLTGLQGQVFVNGTQVTEDQGVVPGDEIVTGLGSAAVLLYPFDSVSEIREDSHLVLTALMVEPDANQPAPRAHAEFELRGTNIWNSLTELVKTFFSFSSATVEDNPSEFGVSIEDGKLVVRVKEGEAKLTSGGQTVTVGPGQQSSAVPDQPPQEPTAWSEIEQQQDLPDLIVSIDGPSTARPGEEIGNKLEIEVSNIGGAPAPGTNEAGEDGYMVDFVLSTDDVLPVRFATFSPNFSEDVLLQGGRVSQTSTLGAGKSGTASGGEAFIPADTPPGVYCLGVVADPGNVISEASESNNTACHRIDIISPDEIPPQITITNPDTDSGPNDDAYSYDDFDDDRGLWYKDVVLQGSATDNVDGTLSGSSLVWTTDREDIQDPFLDTGTSVTVRLYSNECTGVWHEITLTGTDSSGNSNTAVRRIWIWTIC